MFRKLRFGFLIAFIAASLLIAAFVLPGNIQIQSKNFLSTEVAHVYNFSIKATDLVFLPISLTATRALPVVTVTPTDKWDRMTFSWDDYHEITEVLVSGENFVVNLPHNSPYKKANSFLFEPFTENLYWKSFDSIKAKSLGYVSEEVYLVDLKIGDFPEKIFVATQLWNELMLSGARVPDDSSLYDVEFSDSGMSKNELTVGVSREESLSALEYVLYQTSDENFQKMIPLLLDLDSLYKCSFIQTTSGRTYGENTNLLFNPGLGRFEVVSINSNCTSNYLAARVFSFEGFREKRDQLIETAQNNVEIQNDLSESYNSLSQQSFGSILRDFSKKTTNGSFLKLKEKVLSSAEQTPLFPIFSNLETKKATYQEEEPGLIRSIFSNKDTFLFSHPIFIDGGNDVITLKSGTYNIDQNIIVPHGLQLVIEEGVTLLLDKNVSILSYSPVFLEGTPQRPIVFDKKMEEKWGTFAVVNTKESSVVKNTKFSNGSGALLNGAIFTGIAAFHNADVDIKNSSFRGSGNDDGLNIKYSEFLISSSTFSQNLSDAVDIDFAEGDSQIVANKFIDNGYGGGGDGIDLSWSEIKIIGNTINGCTDKGVSVGESSGPQIEQNVITRCDIGIAVKDKSQAFINDNTIKNTRVGIYAYVKKSEFGPSVAFVHGNEFINQTTEYLAENGSQILEQ